MDMILGAADRVNRRADVSRDAGDIGPQARLQVRFDGVPARSNAEHVMNPNRYERMIAHFVPSLRDSELCWDDLTRDLRPGL